MKPQYAGYHHWSPCWCRHWSLPARAPPNQNKSCAHLINHEGSRWKVKTGTHILMTETIFRKMIFDLGFQGFHWSKSFMISVRGRSLWATTRGLQKPLLWERSHVFSLYIHWIIFLTFQPSILLIRDWVAVFHTSLFPATLSSSTRGDPRCPQARWDT